MKELKTTGDLREFLAESMVNLRNGSMKIDEANSLHKLAKNISDSLYSETKIAMFSKNAGRPDVAYGCLPLGNPLANESKK